MVHDVENSWPFHLGNTYLEHVVIFKISIKVKRGTSSNYVHGPLSPMVVVADVDTPALL